MPSAASSAPPSSSRASPGADPVRMRLGGALVIVAAAFFIYWPALRGTWLWDDTAELSQNPEITGAGGLARLWLAPSQADYLPLKSTVLWLAWRVCGENTLGYHVLGVALHALSALLLWRLLARLGVRAAWLGGALFAVHPLAVESVAWIAELKNTLALPPLLLAFLAYRRFADGGRRADWAAALAWFAASLLCKASGVMLPVVFLLYHLARDGRLTRRHAWATLPFFAVALAVGLVTIHFQATRAIGDAAMPMGGAGERLGQAGGALAFYVGKFLVPLGLLPIYPPGENFSATAGGAAWAALLLALGAGWRFRRTWGGAVLLGLGAFCVLALPVLGFVPMAYLRYAPVADHFAYVPMLGLIGLAAAGAGAVARERRSHRAGRIAAAAVLVLCAGLSRSHAARFRDQKALWSFTLEHNPAAWPAHNNLGLVLAAEGEAGAALRHYEAALRLRPELVDARCNLGNALIALGRAAEAIPHFHAALARNPRYAPAHNNLGVALRRSGAPAEAIGAFEAALRLKPDYTEAHNNLGNTLLDLGRAAEAVPHYEAALRLDPRFALAHYNLALALRELGRNAEARVHHAEARRLNPALPALAF